MKNYLIKNANLLCKKQCFAFDAILDVSSVAFDHALLVHTSEIFCFHRYDSRALQICINLISNTFHVSHKKGGEFCIFFARTKMIVCSNLVVNSDLFPIVVMPGKLCYAYDNLE